MGGPNKQELINKIQSERAKWDDLIGTLSPGSLAQPGVVGEWSIKDLHAHLTAWESRPIAWLKGMRDGTKPEPAPWSSDMTEEQVNDWIRQTNRDKALETVLAESRRSFEELVSLLHSTSEEDLTTPKRFGWVSSGSVADAIPANTYEHYEEHGAQIRAWLKRDHGG